MDSDSDTLTGGLPHSEIPGSTIARISPGLIAACYVLHRLSVPRHPPDALDYALEHHTQRQRPDCIAAAHLVAEAANSLEDTCWDMHQPPALQASQLVGRPAGHALLCHVTYSLIHPVNQRTATKVSSLQSRKGTSCRVTTEAPRYVPHQKWWR